MILSPSSQQKKTQYFPICIISKEIALTCNRRDFTEFVEESQNGMELV